MPIEWTYQCNGYDAVHAVKRWWGRERILDVDEIKETNEVFIMKVERYNPRVFRDDEYAEPLISRGLAFFV